MCQYTTSIRQQALRRLFMELTACNNETVESDESKKVIVSDPIFFIYFKRQARFW
jgi:hypothetical protein